MKKTNSISYKEYKSLLEKWKSNNDYREINIQNEVIKPFLKSILTRFDVIDVAKKGPNTNQHEYSQYCGIIDDKEVTPDLVVAENWNWYNVDNKVKYLFTVEVKSPFMRERIYDRDIKNDGKIAIHLSARENNKVLFTDGVKFIFFDKTIDNFKEFCLYEYIEIERKWTWKTDDTFDELKEYIEKFIFENKIQVRYPNYFFYYINVGQQLIKNKLVQWNYFKEIDNSRVETFKFEEPMKCGDYILFYITKKGLDNLNHGEIGYGKDSGFYALGRVLSSKPIIKNDGTDVNDGQQVIQVDIEYYNKNKPFEPLEKFINHERDKIVFINENISKKFLDTIEQFKCIAENKPYNGD